MNRSFEKEQIRLNQLLEQIKKKNIRVGIIFEGRDSAGKSSSIRDITKYCPNKICVVYDSKKPNKTSMKRWLKSWSKKMPLPGQVAFYDRSWYSRALVQPMNGWCGKSQYKRFMRKVILWEESRNVYFIKIWASITKPAQNRRLFRRKKCPLRYWRFSENDKISLDYYSKMTLLFQEVFNLDHKWNVVDYDSKVPGKLSSIKIINSELERIIIFGNK